MNPNNLTQEQIKQGYSTIPGAYDPLTGKLKTSNVITPQSLQPQPQIQLPQTPQIVTPTTPVDQPNITETMLKTLESDKTDAQKVQETGISEILKSFSGLDGEAQALATEKEKAGVNILRQDLQGINSQILKKQAELKQDDIQLIANMRGEERRDTLLPFAQMGQAKLAGDAQIVRALKNAEIGVLNATAIAKQGDIALAQQTAEEAVAIKYEPYKDNIRKWENTLKVIEPLLTRDEKKQAEVQKIKGQLAMREIEKVEENEKTSNSYLFTAIQGKAPANLIAKAQDLINKGAKPNEVAKVLGDYSMSVADKLELELKKAQINSANASAASSNRANRETGGKLLSVTEAQAAGVPYGTTEGQLMLMGNQQKGPKTDFNFLKQTAQKASDLSGGAGNTWLNEAVANTFGISEKKRLGPLTDTLRVNVLTMSTDPNIKKFFGPQMTENDVRMMTGAGTTLDPNTQNTADYAAEAARIYDMVNRAQVAVEEGLKREQLSNYIDSTSTALQVVNSPFIQ